MNTETKVYKTTAWAVLGRRMCGRKMKNPAFVYASIDMKRLPLFATRKECKRWIDEDSGDGKKAFGLFPARVAVTIEYANPLSAANSAKGTA